MKFGAWLKWGILIKRDRLRFWETFQKGGQGSFCSEMFYNGYKNLLEIYWKMCLASQFFYSAFNVVDKSYRQVLTPVKNSQLLLKLEILDKLRLVTFHRNKTERKCNVYLVQTRKEKHEFSWPWTTEHRHYNSCRLSTHDIFSLTQHKIWHFAATIWYIVVIT